jgi:hypothetical protein
VTVVAGRRGAIVWPLMLAVAFATFAGMIVELAGRVHAAPLAGALAVGALAVAVLVAGRPIPAVASMDRRDQLLACAAGLMLVFGAPALVAGVRMTDAPAGSVVVFWMSGGWAAIAALAGVAWAWRRSSSLAGLALAGGVAALAGAAGVVADWERPSSFSPLVRFPSQELAILAAGVLVVAGVMLLVRAARGGKLDGPLVCATGAATVAGLLWWVVDGMSTGALTERPLEFAIAAVAWGAVCVALPRVVRSGGPARAGAMLALAPLLLTSLIGVEQVVGVAGPQPMVAGGVAAGALVLVASSMALWRSGGVSPVVRVKLPLWTWLAAVPLGAAAIGLALPSIIATATVSKEAGRFVGSWTLLGWESVAGLSALALGGLAGALARVERPIVPAAVALVACAGWTLLGDVPMHVLKAGLAPGIEQYYGTEYGSIAFVAVANPWSVAAVVLAASVLVVVIAVAFRRMAVRTAGVKNER